MIGTIGEVTLTEVDYPEEGAASAGPPSYRATAWLLTEVDKPEERAAGLTEVDEPEEGAAGVTEVTRPQEDRLAGRGATDRRLTAGPASSIMRPCTSVSCKCARGQTEQWQRRHA